MPAASAASPSPSSGVHHEPVSSAEFKAPGMNASFHLSELANEARSGARRKMEPMTRVLSLLS
jgi:hypothetical protein